MGSKVIRNITKVFRSASGVLFGRSTAGTGRGEEIAFASIPALIGVYTTAEVDSIIGGIEGLTSADIDTLAEINAILTDADLASVSYVDNGLSGKQATLVSGTNIKTVNSTSLLGSGDITVGLSGTGSVDNAALRADGTGGATLQSSAWLINDNLTASPNNTVNHACLEATGGTTDVSVSIKPKGAGAFCLSPPDATSTGGDARGSNAIDLQRIRSNANQVASGANSFVSGKRNRASGSDSAAWGDTNSCTGPNTNAFGVANTVSGQYAVGYGSGNTVSGYASMSCGNYGVPNNDGAITYGWYGTAASVGQSSDGGGMFAVAGDCQRVRHIARYLTTGNTPAALGTYWSVGKTPTNRMLIPSGKILFATVLISGIKSDGSAVACYMRKVAIKNVGGTTALVGSVETLGTDHEDNASTDVSITADNTNDCLTITVTGIAAETWRWQALVDGIEMAYGA